METTVEAGSEVKIDADALVRRYRPLVAAICCRMIENRDTAEEATQEAWIEILKSLPSFKGNSKVSTWIYKIAGRAAIRYSAGEKKYSTRAISSSTSSASIRRGAR